MIETGAVDLSDFCLIYGFFQPAVEKLSDGRIFQHDIMDLHGFEIFAFRPVVLRICNTHKFIRIEFVPLYDLLEERGSVFCQSDDLSGVFIIKNIVGVCLGTVVIILISVNIFLVPQVQALQVLKVHSCVE